MLTGRFADELAHLHQVFLVADGAPTEVLTGPILSRYYRTPAQVLAAADGGAVIVPLRQRNESKHGAIS